MEEIKGNQFQRDSLKFETKTVHVENGRSFQHRNVGQEGHTFVVVYDGESPISQLVLGPTENLQTTQIRSDLVMWLRQRTGLGNLEVEAMDQNIGIITDTVKPNVF